VKLSATIAMALGLWGAWMAYIRAPGFPAQVAEQFRIVYDFLLVT